MIKLWNLAKMSSLPKDVLTLLVVCIPSIELVNDLNVYKYWRVPFLLNVAQSHLKVSWVMKVLCLIKYNIYSMLQKCCRTSEPFWVLKSHLDNSKITFYENSEMFEKLYWIISEESDLERAFIVLLVCQQSSGLIWTELKKSSCSHFWYNLQCDRFILIIMWKRQMWCLL